MSAEHIFRFVEWLCDCQKEELINTAKEMIPIIGIEAVVSLIEELGENI